MTSQQPDYSNVRKLVSGDVTVKCRHGNDIRRIVISQAPTFDELCLMMTRVFKLAPTDDLTLKYTDSENDLISLLDDNDITHAISLSNLLKITVTTKNVSGDLSALQVDGFKTQLRALRGELDAVLLALQDINAAVAAPAKPVAPAVAPSATPLQAKASVPSTPTSDPKFKPLSASELGDKGSDQASAASAGTSSNKATPIVKNAFLPPPPGTPKQAAMASPAMQAAQANSSVTGAPQQQQQGNYGPPRPYFQQAGPGSPFFANAKYMPAYNNGNNARPPPPPQFMQHARPPPNGYQAPGTPNLSSQPFRPPYQQQQQPVQPNQPPQPNQLQQASPASASSNPPAHAQHPQQPQQPQQQQLQQQPSGQQPPVAASAPPAQPPQQPPAGQYYPMQQQQHQQPGAPPQLQPSGQQVPPPPSQQQQLQQQQQQQQPPPATPQQSYQPTPSPTANRW
ncbi:PB1 domain-containing protein [Gongronella butleri]|nr:PB1 domain-containing protein [Gongronella butleri]